MNIEAPHHRLLAGIDSPSSQEKVLTLLFDLLWDEYRQELPDVQTYERLVADENATFTNDHIAFRTLASQSPQTGIASLSRIFESLGYLSEGCYVFPSKHLSAVHLRHPQASFPKLFISELRLWELPASAQMAATASLASHRPLADNVGLTHLAQGLSRQPDLELLARQLASLFSRPWDPPQWSDVQAMHAVSQYGAWTLLHGYRVNHFTALINSHQSAKIDTIEKTVDALKAAGVGMKADIEGQPGSKLRQTATSAVDVAVEVRRGSKVVMEDWSYAYFELAQRGFVTDPETGESVRFEGFLGAQATELFEMTKR